MYQLVFPNDFREWSDVINAQYATWERAALRLSDRLANGEAFPHEAVRLPDGGTVLLDDWLFIRLGRDGGEDVLAVTETWPEWDASLALAQDSHPLAPIWARAARTLTPTEAL